MFLLVITRLLGLLAPKHSPRFPVVLLDSSMQVNALFEVPLVV